MSYSAIYLAYVRFIVVCVCINELGFKVPGPRQFHDDG